MFEFRLCWHANAHYYRRREHFDDNGCADNLCCADASADDHTIDCADDAPDLAPTPLPTMTPVPTRILPITNALALRLSASAWCTTTTTAAATCTETSKRPGEQRTDGFLCLFFNTCSTAAPVHLPAPVRPTSSTFNEDIASWNTSSATTMAGMFFGAFSFNSDVSAWDREQRRGHVCDVLRGLILQQRCVVLGR